MAAATAIIAAGAAVYSIGKGIHDSSVAAKEKRRAQKALDNYQRSDLGNVYAGLSLPTQAYEMERQSIQQSQAENIGMLSQVGARGTVGGANRIMATTTGAMSDLSSKLAESQFRIDQLKAGDEARIQQMKDQREQADVSGLGAQIAGSTMQQQSAQNTIISTLGSVAELSKDTKWGNQKLWGNNPAPTTSV